MTIDQIVDYHINTKNETPEIANQQKDSYLIRTDRERFLKEKIESLEIHIDRLSFIIESSRELHESKDKELRELRKLARK